MARWCRPLFKATDRTRAHIHGVRKTPQTKACLAHHTPRVPFSTCFVLVTLKRPRPTLGRAGLPCPSLSPLLSFCEAQRTSRTHAPRMHARTNARTPSSASSSLHLDLFSRCDHWRLTPHTPACRARGEMHALLLPTTSWQLKRACVRARMVRDKHSPSRTQWRRRRPKPLAHYKAKPVVTDVRCLLPLATTPRL